MRMERILAAAIVLVAATGVACSRSKGPSNDSSCGSAGGSCSPEGSTCSPAPIGTGWSHALTCQGGTWQEMEIAPLPPPPPTTSAAATDGCATDADCVLVFMAPPDCCTRCEGRAMTVAARSEIGRACAGMDGYPSCPKLDCPQLLDHAACDHGACVAVGVRTPVAPSASH